MLKNKTFLITGPTGFVGACLAHRLVEMGCETHAILREGSNTWRINGILDKLQIHRADLANLPELSNAVREAKPDIIYHTAAYATYPHQTDVNRMIQTNIIGTSNLLNACCATGFESFVNAGSSSEYGQKDRPIKETDLLEPSTPYGATKTCATLLCQMEAKNKNLPINTIRIFSAYGFFEERARLIPTAIKACLTGENPKLGPPNSVRDYIFVEDIVGLFLRISESPEICGQIFNAGGGRQRTTREVVEMIIKITESKVKPLWGEVSARLANEPKCWEADMTKARDMLGWAPMITLEEGLSKTIKWFNKNMVYYEQRE